MPNEGMLSNCCRIFTIATLKEAHVVHTREGKLLIWKSHEVRYMVLSFLGQTVHVSDLQRFFQDET